MKPALLIHGYSAESKETTKSAITAIYGDLPKALRKKYGAANVVEIDLSRYISLDDGITLEDVARALDRVLNDKFSHLLQSGFHSLVHSTGALVIRNWLRLFSPRPSPLQNLVYLAGANFGSGWGHVGKGQLAKWGRMVFQGSERGVPLLTALELGSDATIDMHLEFLEAANSLPDKYKVFEHVVIGTQADPGWFESPLRYAKEDGSDGVVRVCGSNLNFGYVQFSATDEAKRLSWNKAKTQRNRVLARGTRGRQELYTFTRSSKPGIGGRPVIPFAIPYQCAHSGEDMGVVTGSKPREQVLNLIDLALKTTAGNWSGRVTRFNEATDSTYERARVGEAPGFFGRLVSDQRAQYDNHAQVIFRLRDQDGKPIQHFDIFFNSPMGPGNISIGTLIEDKHINQVSPNIITYYLRTNAFNSDTNTWEPRVASVNGCYLEISATEPLTDEVLYLPFRHQFTQDELVAFLQPNRTTVIDIEMIRLPSPGVFKAVKF